MVRKNKKNIIIFICFLLFMSTVGALIAFNNVEIVEAQVNVIHSDEINVVSIDDITNVNNDEKGGLSPQIDTFNLINASLSSGYFIPNYEYFTTVPTIGQNNTGVYYANNNTGTCGPIAAQLLLGYHNYYDDRRIIGDNYLNGYDDNLNQVVTEEYNPNYCVNPTSMTKWTTGTRSDGNDPNSFYYRIITEIMSPNQEGANFYQVRNGIISYLNSRLLSSDYVIHYDEATTLLGDVSVINPEIVKAELEAGRPVILELNESLGGIDHFVVAYGYQDYTYPVGHPNAGETYPGYVVHFGWSNLWDERVWVDENWCRGYISIEFSHTHNYNIDTGKNVDVDGGTNYDKREVRCGVCGHRTLDDLYQTNEAGNTITGLNYPVAGDLILPLIVNNVWIDSIGPGVFSNSTGLTTIDFGNAIKSIGANAFENCSNLTSILQSLGIRSIGAQAFKGCSSLTGVSGTGLSSATIYIGSSAFENCSSLTGFSTGGSISLIGTGAFNNCSSLLTFSVSGGIAIISSQAFKGCSALQSFVVPQNTNTIGLRAFQGCYNMTITVANGNSYFSAEDNVLYNAGKTKVIGAGAIPSDICIPSTVSTVNAYAFSGNSALETVRFESSPNINIRAFSNCANLRELFFYSTIIPTLGSGAFLNDNVTAVHVPYSKQSEYRTLFNGYSFGVDSMPITVTFNDGNTTLSSLDTYYGAYINNLPSPNVTGYTNLGWYDNSNFTGEPLENGDIWQFREGTTVYLKKEPNTYNISFSGYGSDGFLPKEVTFGEAVGTLPSINRVGYTFLGWKTQNNEYVTAETVWNTATDVTLVSAFSANQYTITLNGNGGTVSPASIDVYYDDVISALPSATLAGHTFYEWRTSDNLNSGITLQLPFTYQFTESIVLYAFYTTNQYSVNFDKQNGSGGTSGVNATYGSPMPTGESITAPSRVGYTFCGYYSDANGMGTKYYNSDMTSAHVWDQSDDVALYAYWSGNVYSVTLIFENGSGINDSIEVTFGSDMPTGVSAPTKTGYTFGGYYTQTYGLGTKYYNADMTSAHVWSIAENTSLYAYWTVNTYVVTLDMMNGTGGTAYVEVQYLSILPSSAVAPTRQGYRFEGYYTDVNGSGDLCYNSQMTSQFVWSAASDGTIYAYWVQNQYTVTLNNGGYGANYNIIVTYDDQMPFVTTIPTRNHYIIDGYYDTNGVKYYDGQGMVSVRNWDKCSDDVLYVRWIGESYFINYNNTAFNNSTAVVTVNHSYANLAPTTYRYGEGLDLTNITAFISLGGPYEPQLVFLGWYSDMTFSTRVYSISSSSTGTVNVYAKWRYDKGYLYRTSGWDINNSDPLNQGYEYLSTGMDSSLYSELTNLGISQVVIRFWIRIKGNGTQYVYLYNGNTRLATQEFHAPSTTEYSTFYCSFTVSLSSIQSASTLQIRYQASTSWFLFIPSSHSWQTDKSFAEVAFVEDPNDLNSPEFTWHENNVLC